MSSREKSKSLAVKLSPKFVKKSEAISMKRARRSEIALREVGRELTLREAEALQGEQEKEILVTPKGTESNKLYEEMQELSQSLEGIDLNYLKEFMEEEKKEKLYTQFVGASRQVCEYDLLMFLIRALDFYTMKAFKENEVQLGPLIIPSVVADEWSVSYLSLGKALDSGHFYPQQIAVVEHIMSRAEEFMLHYINLPLSNSSIVRNECRQFYSSSALREDRNFSAHVFSSALATNNVNHTSPSPPLKPIAVNFWRERTLRCMALRALVLKDLETHFIADALEEDYDTLHQCGLRFVKKLMAQHIPFSLKISYGSLEAEVLREGDSSEDISAFHTYELRDVNYGELSIAGSS